MPESSFKGDQVWPRMVGKKLLRRRPFGSNSVADFPCPTGFQEQSFSTDDFISSNFTASADKKETNKYKLFTSTWNVAGIPPPDNLNLEDLLDTGNNFYDIYVLGFQEVVPLNAKNVLGPENASISTKWNSLIGATLNIHSRSFRCLISKRMVGIMLTVWVRADLLPSIHHPTVSYVGCGIMGFLGNKGSVSVSFSVQGTSFCVICCHLASGGKEGDEIQRNSDAMEIFSRTRFSSSSGPSLDSHRRIFDHDRIIMLGDLNYRVSLPDEETRSLVLQKEWTVLMNKDQLKAELAKGRAFGEWREGDIFFPPTYKYYPNSDEYYGIAKDRKGEKRRAPAWCDRILWQGTGLIQTGYKRCESAHSDHRPVCATFNVEVGVI